MFTETNVGLKGTHPALRSAARYRQAGAKLPTCIVLRLTRSSSNIEEESAP
jgi:hypothetical protein